MENNEDCTGFLNQDPQVLMFQSCNVISVDADSMNGVENNSF